MREPVLTIHSMVMKMWRRRHDVLVRSAAAVIMTCAVGAASAQQGSDSVPTVAQNDETVGASRRTAIVEAVDTAAPAVVSIAAEQIHYVREVVPFFDFDSMFPFDVPGFSRSRAHLVSSLSSGVLFSDEGLILTNEHGVPDNATLTVTLPDGREVSGNDVKVVGKHFDTDIALLDINLDDTPVAALGRSDDLMIGEWTIAIGNPFGYVLGDPKPSVSVGVVSALDRWFSSAGGERRIYRNMIQTDASINQGNSGGPLVNAAGRVIGINTFILSGSGGSIGIGFAIPIDRARRVADEILAYGHVRPVNLGFSVESVDEGIARMLGLSRSSGVVVVELLDAGSAAQGGLKIGDLIYEVNGRPTNNIEDARMVFKSLMVGDRVDAKIERAGKDISIGFDITELK